MSRLFPERLLVRISADALQLGAKRIPCESADGAEAWRGAVACLERLDLGGARVTIELSNHFVRYALIPWSDALATPAEEELYVRHHFSRVHGERAKAWAVRASDAPVGHPRLASAVDAALIAALRLLEKKGGAKLVSIQPALMSRFNAMRRALPADGAWIVLAEPERTCIALHGGRRWRAVRSTRGDWRAGLESERHRMDGAVPALVLLAGAQPPSNDAFFRFRAIAV